MTTAGLFRRGRVTLPNWEAGHMYVAWRCDQVHARAVSTDAGDRGHPLSVLAGTSERIDYGTTGAPVVRLALLILAHHLDEEDVTVEDLRHGSRMRSCPACATEADCPDCGGLGFQLVELHSSRESRAFAETFLVKADATLPLVIRGERIDRWLRDRLSTWASPRTTTTIRERGAREPGPARPKGDE